MNPSTKNTQDVTENNGSRSTNQESLNNRASTSTEHSNPANPHNGGQQNPGRKSGAPNQGQQNQSQEKFGNRSQSAAPQDEQLGYTAIRDDARYVAQRVSPLISMIRQLYRATNIICWIIIVLFFLCLLIGFFLPLTRTYASPRISIGGSSFPNSEYALDSGFPLLTQYPLILFLAFVFTIALYYTTDYIHDLLVKIERVSGAIQTGQFVPRRL